MRSPICSRYSLVSLVLLCWTSYTADTFQLSLRRHVDSHERPASRSSPCSASPAISLSSIYSTCFGERRRHDPYSGSLSLLIFRHRNPLWFQAVHNLGSNAEENHPAVDEQDEPSQRALPIVIEQVTFGGLRSVAKLFVEEFSGYTLWFPVQYLAELNRLQSKYHSFEEDAFKHMMFVATLSSDGSLAGFVDVDGRARRIGQGVPPRPYLSDLVVSSRYRRRGVATALVRACEKACLHWGYDRMYLKVTAGNVAAEKLYQSLGYDIHSPKDNKGELVLCGTLGATDAAEDPRGD